MSHAMPSLFGDEPEEEELVDAAPKPEEEPKEKDDGMQRLADLQDEDDTGAEILFNLPDAVPPPHYSMGIIDDVQMTVGGKAIEFIPKEIRCIGARLVELPNDTGKIFPPSVSPALAVGRMCGEDGGNVEKKDKYRTKDVIQRYGPTIKVDDKYSVFAAYTKVSVPEPSTKHNEIGLVRNENAWFCHLLVEWCQRVDFLKRDVAAIRAYQLVWWPLSRLILQYDVPRPLTTDNSRMSLFPNGWTLIECQQLRRDDVITIGGTHHRIGKNSQLEYGVWAKPCRTDRDTGLVTWKAGYSKADWPFYFYSDIDKKDAVAEETKNLVHRRKQEVKRSRTKQKNKDKKEAETKGLERQAQEEANRLRDFDESTSPRTSMLSEGTRPKSRRAANLNMQSPSQSTPGTALLSSFMLGDHGQNAQSSTPGATLSGTQPSYREVVGELGEADRKIALQNQQIMSLKHQEDLANRRCTDQNRSFGKKVTAIEKVTTQVEEMGDKFKESAVIYKEAADKYRESAEIYKDKAEDMINAVCTAQKEEIAAQFERLAATGYFSSSGRSRSSTPRRGMNRSRDSSPKRSPRSLRRLLEHSPQPVHSGAEPVPKKAKITPAAPSRHVTPPRSIPTPVVHNLTDESSPEDDLYDDEYLAAPDWHPEEFYSHLTQMKAETFEHPPKEFRADDPFWNTETFDEYVRVLEEIIPINVDAKPVSLLRAKTLCWNGVDVTAFWATPAQLVFKFDHCLVGDAMRDAQGMLDDGSDSDQQPLVAPKPKKHGRGGKGISLGGKKPRASVLAGEPNWDTENNSGSGEEQQKETSEPIQKRQKSADNLAARKRSEEKRRALEKAEKQKKHKGTPKPPQVQQQPLQQGKKKSFFAQPPAAALATAAETAASGSSTPVVDKKFLPGQVQAAIAVAVSANKPKKHRQPIMRLAGAGAMSASDSDNPYPNDATKKRDNDEPALGELTDFTKYNDAYIKTFMPDNWEKDTVARVAGYKKTYATPLAFVRAVALQLAHLMVEEGNCKDVRGPMDMWNHCLRATEQMKYVNGFRQQSKLCKPIYPLYAIVERAMATRNLEKDERDVAVKSIVQHIGHNYGNTDWKVRAKAKRAAAKDD